MKNYKLVLPIATGLFLSTFAFNVFATGNHKVTICHRTDSATNPYVKITVDDDAVDGQAASHGNHADHYGEHKGPLAYSEAYAQQLKDSHIEWGDIIPPVAPYHSGQNWDTQGQTILNNGCKFVIASPSPTPTLVPTPTPSPSPSPRVSPSPTPSPSVSPSPSPKTSPSPTPSPSPSPTPSASPSPTPSASPSPSPSASPSPTPSTSPSPSPNASPSPTPTPTPTVSPSPTPTPTPTPQVASVKVLPATGLGVLGMTAIFAGGPLGLMIANYSRGRKEDNLSEFASEKHVKRNA